uniref:Transmembrane protein n=1 Tax=viral metagenome TaxID=1070528 RepID=A0A6C0ATU1_9ZZZZ
MNAELPTRRAAAPGAARPSFEQRAQGSAPSTAPASEKSFFEKHGKYIAIAAFVAVLLAVLIPILHNKSKKKNNGNQQGNNSAVMAQPRVTAPAPQAPSPMPTANEGHAQMQSQAPAAPHGVAPKQIGRLPPQVTDERSMLTPEILRVHEASIKGPRDLKLTTHVYDSSVDDEAVRPMAGFCARSKAVPMRPATAKTPSIAPTQLL